MVMREAVPDSTTADAHARIQGSFHGRPHGSRVRVCTRCDRVNYDGSWVHAGVVIRALETYRQPEPPAVVNVSCPDCLARVAALRRRGRFASLHGAASAGLSSPGSGYAA